MTLETVLQTISAEYFAARIEAEAAIADLDAEDFGLPTDLFLRALEQVGVVSHTGRYCPEGHRLEVFWPPILWVYRRHNLPERLTQAFQTIQERTYRIEHGMTRRIVIVERCSQPALVELYWQ